MLWATLVANTSPVSHDDLVDLFIDEWDSDVRVNGGILFLRSNITHSIYSVILHIPVVCLCY